MPLTPCALPERFRALALVASLIGGLAVVPAPAWSSEAPAAATPESSIKPRLKPELRGEAQSARGEVKSEARAEPKAEPKAGAKAEPKAESKAEAKADTKAEAKPEVKPELKVDAKEPVSMAELRDMIEQKVSEVRSTRGPAPVVRVKAKGPRGASAAGSSGAAAPARKGNWSYHGDTGPAHWAQLKPEFALCGSGQRQSPIDIRDGIPVELDPIQFDYKLSAFRVIDNGHTVQVNVEPGNRIVVNGRRFDLVQFHFHRPSEEKLNGRQFEMVAHLEHRDLEGKLAVVAVLIDEGKAHPLVQQVWNNLPLEKHTEQPGLNALDPNLLLPERRQYVTYMGSVTTPPCTEGVLWMVMKEPVTLSRQQIGIFSRLYPMNARPVQPTGDRLIKDGQ